MTSDRLTDLDDVSRSADHESGQRKTEWNDFGRNVALPSHGEF